jgi:hypothetical protein
MLKLKRSEFEHKAKVFAKSASGAPPSPYLTSRSTAKYCTNTCRAYAAQAKVSNEMAPWPEEERTIDSMLHQIAHLKVQLAQAYRDMDQMREQYENKIKQLEKGSSPTHSLDPGCSTSKTIES